MASPKLTRPSFRRAASRAVAPLIGVALLASVWIIGFRFYRGFLLDFGSLFLPRSKSMAFHAIYGALGGLAVLALGVGFADVSGAQRLWRACSRSLNRESTRNFLILAMLLAFLLPFALRLFLFEEAPFTDDEDCYLFSARLLFEGKLYAASPPNKIFFDRQFMVNDGHWYSQYFLGWPALLAPFAALGLPSVANPLYSALTVPALYGLGRQYGSTRTARLATLLYLVSPQMVIASATLLSHTSCWMALAWTLLLATKLLQNRASDHDCVCLALFFCLAVFIRPLTAMGFGLFLVPAVAWALWRQGRAAWRRALLLALPCIACGALFLAVNASQTGSPFLTAYGAVLKYKESQGWKFSLYSEEMRVNQKLVHLSNVPRAFAVAAAALFRLDASLHGWPASLLLAIAAWRLPRTRSLCGVVASFFFVQSLGPSVGIDVFGPPKFLEISIVLILLGAIGYCRLRALEHRFGPWRSGTPGQQPRQQPLEMLFLAAILAYGVIYLPVRLKALRTVANRVNSVRQLPARANVHSAVVFAPPIIWGPCNVTPEALVFSRPENSPNLSDDVLWVNHIDHRADASFMQDYPDRKPYALILDRACVPRLVPLPTPRDPGATGLRAVAPKAATSHDRLKTSP